jgi:hypothetical protein
LVVIAKVAGRGTPISGVSIEAEWRPFISVRPFRHPFHHGEMKGKTRKNSHQRNPDHLSSRKIYTPAPSGHAANIQLLVVDEYLNADIRGWLEPIQKGQ